MPDEYGSSNRSSLLPKPEEPSFRWQGTNIIPRRIMQCYQDWSKAMKPSYDAIERVRGLRRGTTVVKLIDANVLNATQTKRNGRTFWHITRESAERWAAENDREPVSRHKDNGHSNGNGHANGSAKRATKKRPERKKVKAK